jgi:hypothetical protein
MLTFTKIGLEEKFLGCLILLHVSTSLIYESLIFFLEDQWSDLEGGGWQLSPWRDYIKANPTKNLILSVGMLPNNPSNVSFGKLQKISKSHLNH